MYNSPRISYGRPSNSTCLPFIFAFVYNLLKNMYHLSEETVTNVYFYSTHSLTTDATDILNPSTRKRNIKKSRGEMAQSDTVFHPICVQKK